MKIELTVKELLEILNEKFDSNVKINDIAIKVKLDNNFEDYIYFSEKEWFFGSFVEKEIIEKNKGE